MKKGFQVSTGLVEGVGPQVATGVLQATSDLNLNPEETLVEKTLPMIGGNTQHMEKPVKEMYQNNMISKAEVVIFLFGNSYYDGDLKTPKVSIMITSARWNRKVHYSCRFNRILCRTDSIRS